MTGNKRFFPTHEDEQVAILRGEYDPHEHCQRKDRSDDMRIQVLEAKVKSLDEIRVGMINTLKIQREEIERLELVIEDLNTKIAAGGSEAHLLEEVIDGED